MAQLANIALSDTFDVWRVRTNQLVLKTNLLETSNIISFVSNSAVITVHGDPYLGNTVYFSSNAFPSTGGLITGDVELSANLTLNAVSQVKGTINLVGNTNITGNVVIDNYTVQIANGVLDLLS